LALVGLVLLIVFTYWWASSLRKNKLVSAQRTWIPALSILNVDFLNYYHSSRHWCMGGNPYKEAFGDPLNCPFINSPMVLAAFSWGQFVPQNQAVRIWVGVLGLLASIGALAAWRNRRDLALAPLPFLFVWGVVLCSTPVLFALERGNSDLLLLLLLVLTATALQRHTWFRDLCVGLFLGAAVWLKVYPALLVPGLLALGRPRALVCSVFAFLAIGLASPSDTLQHIESMRLYAARYDIGFHESAHPFSTYWKHLWENTRLAPLTAVPGMLGAALVLLPLVLWVSFQVHRSLGRGKLYYPYLLWLTAAATFLSPISNDYNLFFLPLAVLIVWDRRDPVLVHVMMAVLLLWWQPMHLPIGPKLLFVFKLAGLTAAAISLINRAREQVLDIGNVTGGPNKSVAPRPAVAA
jgi:hypothetical protein